MAYFKAILLNVFTIDVTFNHVWKNKPVLKYFKLSKYIDRGCRLPTFLHINLNWRKRSLGYTEIWFNLNMFYGIFQQPM